MREIKFRGKNIRKRFIYGYLIKIDENYFIIDDSIKKAKEPIKVKYQTVGQYTGVLDMDGVESYDGDVISDGDCNYFIKYEDGRYLAVMVYDDGAIEKFNLEAIIAYCKVVGNIHDNPDIFDLKDDSESKN